MIYAAMAALAVWAVCYVARNLVRQARGKCACGSCKDCGSCGACGPKK